MSLGRDAASYLLELYSLLPRGPIWPTLPLEAAGWDNLLYALAQEPARVDEDATNWLLDFFPDTTTLQLEDWERLLGLPDCGVIGSVSERQAAVVARLQRSASPTLANIQALADVFDQGAVITTGGTEDLFYVGTSTVGDTPVSNYDATTAVYVTYDAPQSDVLECTIRHALPIHLTVYFEVV